MTDPKKTWYQKWFNEDYLKLYADHDEQEAEKHIAFIIDKFALKDDWKILDLGCGTGRHSIALAKRGFHVVGIDQSPTMIKEANHKISKTNLPVRFEMADVRHVKLDQFNLVISLFTSFGYEENERENANILKVIYQHLLPNGYLFLDFLNPKGVLRSLKPLEEKWIDGERVIIKKEIIKDVVIKTIYFPGRTYQEKVKLYTRDILEKMLTDQHFKILHVWNDYEGNPWKEDGDRQLFACQVASKISTYT